MGNLSMSVSRLALVLLLSSAATAAFAADAPAFKFTTGIYHFGAGGGTPSGQGVDFNLRHTSALGNLWVGYWRGPDHATQLRGGWDHTFDTGMLRIQPSVQLASGGFAGGSLYAETGDTWFAGAGIGRTNLAPYVNLNFDPNDAWTVAGGYRWADNHVVTATLVGDNRENPDQRHVHLQYRVPVEDHRLLFDVLVKRGLVDGAMVRRVGWTAGYDGPHYFVRLARDPKANFTPQDMTRLQVGTRF